MIHPVPLLSAMRISREAEGRRPHTKGTGMRAEGVPDQRWLPEDMEWGAFGLMGPGHCLTGGQWLSTCTGGLLPGVRTGLRFENELFALRVPCHWGKASSVPERGTAVPLLINAAAAPWRPSHAGAGRGCPPSLGQRPRKFLPKIGFQVWAH